MSWVRTVNSNRQGSHSSGVSSWWYRDPAPGPRRPGRRGRRASRRTHGRRRQLGMLVVGGQQQRPAVAVPARLLGEAGRRARLVPVQRPGQPVAEPAAQPVPPAQHRGPDELLGLLAVADRQALVAGDPLHHVGRALDVVPGQGSNIDVKAHAASLAHPVAAPARARRCLELYGVSNNSIRPPLSCLVSGRRPPPGSGCGARRPGSRRGRPPRSRTRPGPRSRRRSAPGAGPGSRG